MAIGGIGLCTILWLAWVGRGILLHQVVRARALGVWAPLAFLVIYALSVVLFIPGTVLTVTGGALFGFSTGVLCSLAGASLGSTGAFLIGRHLARGVLEARLSRMPRFQALDRAVAADGRRIVLLLRLSPVMPFNVLNYALGITRIRLGDFVAASIGMLPGALVYAYAGKMAGEALALAGEVRPDRNVWYYLLLGGGFAATVTATVVVGRTAQRALATVADV